MTVVFDMDNTLVDSFGGTPRPGVAALLERLLRDGHMLVLWTNSRRQRAHDILRLHDLRKFFGICICREDYDIEGDDPPKDIRIVQGDLLVDDDPAEIAFVKSVGRKGFLIPLYRKGDRPAPKELAELYRTISRSRKFLGLF
ncbi:hypothetical protein ES707_21032 [subsurface metagenome]